MFAEVEVAQRTRAVKGVVVNPEYAVDIDYVVQAAAEHELAAARAFQRCVADEGFQLLAVGKHHVRQGLNGFRKHQRAQMHPLGAVGFHRGIRVILAGIKGVVVRKAHDGHAVDFARHNHVHIRSDVRGNQAGFRIKFKVFGGSRLEGHLHELAHFALAQHGVIPRAGKRFVPCGKLLVCRVGGKAKLRIRIFDSGEREAAGSRNHQLGQLRVRKGSFAHGSIGVQADRFKRRVFKRAFADFHHARQVGGRQCRVRKGIRADFRYIRQVSRRQCRIRKGIRADFGHAGLQRKSGQTASLEHARRNRALGNRHVLQRRQVGEGAFRNDCRIAQDGQLFQSGQTAERIRADFGHGIRNRQLLQLCASGKRPCADGGDGVKQIHILEGAVHECFRADGGKFIVVRNGEVFDGLAVLEYAVAHADDRHFRHRKMRMDARPCAGVFGQHAVVVCIRALFGRLSRRILRAPDAAVQPQLIDIRLPIQHLLSGAAVAQVDIRQIVAALKHIRAQRRRGHAVQNDIQDIVVFPECVRADRLQRRRQVEVTHVAAALKRAFSDGL